MYLMALFSVFAWFHVLKNLVITICRLVLCRLIYVVIYVIVITNCTFQVHTFQICMLLYAPAQRALSDDAVWHLSV